jgi:hypothetical protein
MNDNPYDAYRQERIERLLAELRHEIERGCINREIPEHMAYRFIVPISALGPDFIVAMTMSLRPVARNQMDGDDADNGRLRVIKGGKA